jgi:hypothetical protein
VVMMENELVKAKDVVAELDAVLELEDDVDSVPVEESVLCCALAPSAAKHCNHISGRRMAVIKRMERAVQGVGCIDVSKLFFTRLKREHPSIHHLRWTRMCTYTWVSSCMAAIPRRHR